MKSLETSGMFTQTADQIGKIHGMPMGKKVMTLDDNEEFIAMVISFAERKSMTISNIKEAICAVISYMEDNAILGVGTAEGQAVPTRINRNDICIDHNPEQSNTSDQLQIL